MALYFAELDSNNTVIRVVTAPEDIVSSPNDPAGETWCFNNIPNDPDISLVDGAYPGVAWKQTYKNASDAVTRWNYAGIGWTWDSSNSAFILPKPYPSWTLNSSFKWEAPVAWPSVDDQGNSLPRDRFYEDNLHIYWDENSSGYLGQRVVDGVTITKEWNSDNSTWSIKE